MEVSINTNTNISGLNSNRGESSSTLSSKSSLRLNEQTQKIKEESIKKEIEDSNSDTKNSSLSREDMLRLAESMNKNLNPLSTAIKFAFSEDNGGFYINVVDTANNSIIRRFPSEEAVRLSSKMKEIVGMMFDQKI